VTTNFSSAACTPSTASGCLKNHQLCGHFSPVVRPELFPANIWQLGTGKRNHLHSLINKIITVTHSITSSKRESMVHWQVTQHGSHHTCLVQFHDRSFTF
jgi:hypothetical protein